MVFYRDPFEEFFKRLMDLMKDLEREFSIFERTLPRFGGFSNTFGFNVEEKPEGYLIRIPMPGVDKKDIDVRIDDEKNLIYVNAKSNVEEEKENEFSAAVYNYSFTIPIPEDANKDAIIAKYDKGILMIYIPRKEPKKDRGRKINIE